MEDEEKQEHELRKNARKARKVWHDKRNERVSAWQGFAKTVRAARCLVVCFGCAVAALASRESASLVLRSDALCPFECLRVCVPLEATRECTLVRAEQRASGHQRAEDQDGRRAAVVRAARNHRAVRGQLQEEATQVMSRQGFR